jgi:DNA polymerase beta
VAYILINNYKNRIMSHNVSLLKELQVLYDSASLDTGDKNRTFRMKSYRDAMQKIRLLDFDITKKDQIPLKPSSKIYQKVCEHIEKGEIAQTQEILRDSESAIDIYRELQKISGIGPAKAKKLVEENGVKSLADFDTHPKLKDLLNDKQKIGLRHWKTDQLRIPREEIKRHEKLYRVIAKNIDPNMKLEIMGSYRREAVDSGDIDILVTHPTDKSVFRRFVDKLIQIDYLFDHLAYGDHKYMGYGIIQNVDIPRRIDIIWSPPEEYPFALLYFTGSGNFNVKMREYASRQNFRLNEKCMIDLATNKPVDFVFETENDIFSFLDLEYVEPKNRRENYVFTKI